MVMLKAHIYCAVSMVTMFSCLGIVSEVLAFPANINLSTLKLRDILTKDSEGRNILFSSNYVRSKRQLNIIQSKINDIVHPKPIVDTLREEDKYGNTVEHTFGKKVVKAVENLSNAINAVFAFPVDTVKKVSRTATEALNNIGGKLVGLQ